MSAMRMLDTDYDGMCVDPKQVFFGTESLPFIVKDNTLITVKIVDDRGIERK